MKRTIAALSCPAALVAILTACGSEDDKRTLPVSTGTASTGTASPSTTATSQPTTTQTTPKTTASTGRAALVPHATYTYGGLEVVVNLPVNIPSASRPIMRLVSDFLQATGRTIADNKADPRLRRLAAPEVAKYLTDAMDPRPTTVWGR